MLYSHSKTHAGEQDSVRPYFKIGVDKNNFNFDKEDFKEGLIRVNLGSPYNAEGRVRTFEGTKPTDLKSVSFDHSDTPAL